MSHGKQWILVVEPINRGTIPLGLTAKSIEPEKTEKASVCQAERSYKDPKCFRVETFEEKGDKIESSDLALSEKEKCFLTVLLMT